MKHMTRSIILFVFTGLLLSACGGQVPVTGDNMAPSRLEPIAGTDLSRVILTEKAAERIGIETTIARGDEVPYSAVLYDIEGNTWIYTNPAPFTFVREPIVINHIAGDTAILSESLNTELKVVTVGVAELWGTETGVSK